jgi:hypothetical protein
MRPARDVGGRPHRRDRRRQKTRNPATEDSRRLDDQGCLTPSRRDAGGQSNGESLPRSPLDAARNLPVRHDELLSKKRVLRDELTVTANKVGGESQNEPKEINHVSSYPTGARMAFVASTGAVLELELERMRAQTHDSCTGSHCP